MVRRLVGLQVGRPGRRDGDQLVREKEEENQEPGGGPRR